MADLTTYTHRQILDLMGNAFNASSFLMSMTTAFGCVDMCAPQTCPTCGGDSAEAPQAATVPSQAATIEETRETGDAESAGGFNLEEELQQLVVMDKDIA